MAATLLLREQGYDVMAVTLDTTGDLQLVAKAVQLADRVGVEHRVVDLRAEFRRTVMDYFAAGYMAGETPAPCTLCNSLIKWPVLFRFADALGIAKVATGHYVRIVNRGGRHCVARGSDRRKDQSYYLWGLGQEVLSRVMAPLGGMTKERVREYVAAKGFSDVVRGGESMGVCFLGRGGYRDFLLGNDARAGTIGKGEVVDMEGNVIGTHDGYPFYTAAQKRGFTCFDGCRRVVLAVDAARNRVVAGDNADLYSRTIFLSGCRFTDREAVLAGQGLSVMVRGVGENPSPACQVQVCIVESDNESVYSHYAGPGERVEVRLSEPAWALAKGQPVVFYCDDVVVGGGIVVEFAPAG